MVSANIYSIQEESPFVEREENYEIYREIYGDPIYDVYEDDVRIVDFIFGEDSFANFVCANIGQDEIYAKFGRDKIRAKPVQDELRANFGESGIRASLWFLNQRTILDVMLISSWNLYPFVDESPFVVREYHEIYREIYGDPIYDVYEDDEIYKEICGDPIYDVYEENDFDNLVRAKIGRNLVYPEDFKHNQARAIFVQNSSMKNSARANFVQIRLVKILCSILCGKID
ncbi:hypothetical protein F2Q68_00021100 [Brassica cretica]|uniref:Uncharacterized protein n=1 Tax=Brassica cretica TaxID=69181 RepID=A0A8S9FT37_BRACR|nr:hypothetical protein F2Q68_00021100 [Brassica cretica]